MIEKESESKTEVVAEVKAEEPKGLSRRDALEVAIAVSKDPKLGTVAEPDKPEPVKAEEPVVEKFAAPAEYTPEERRILSSSHARGKRHNLGSISPESRELRRLRERLRICNGLKISLRKSSRTFDPWGAKRKRTKR